MALIDRCDGCHQSFNDPKITAAPILIDETWAKLAGEQETLCAACFFDRAIDLQIDVKLTDLLPCAFNLFHWPRSWYDLFLSKENNEPANLDDWRAAMMTLKLLSARVAGKPSRCLAKDHVAPRKAVITALSPQSGPPCPARPAGALLPPPAGTSSSTTPANSPAAKKKSPRAALVKNAAAERMCSKSCGIEPRRGERHGYG